MMTLVAAGSLIVASGAPASAITGITVTSNPKANLVDLQKVKMTATAPSGQNFNKTATLYFAECSPLAIKKLSEDYCDTTNVVAVNNPSGSTVSATITIHAGSDFKAKNSAGVCGVGAALKCDLLVVDSMTVADVNFFGVANVSFKDLRTPTKTKVSSKKTVKAKKSLTFKAATTHTKGSTKPTGTVLFKDNGKKIGKVKLSSTGKATLKHKFKKAGKQHITATYSGDNTYKPSTGKETITVKK
jgi:hypothetical protein